jgi:NitT/TauT family transport system permease protein
MRTAVIRITSKFILALAVILGWQLFVLIFPRMELLLSTPAKVFTFAVDNLERLLWDFGYTALEAVVGLTIALGTALVAVISIIQRERAGQSLRKLVVSLQVIPIVVFIPFIAMAIGIGVPAKALLAAIVATLPLIAVCLDGYDQLPEYAFDLVGIYKIPRQWAIRKLFLPMLLPDLWAGAKLGATMAVLGAVIAEFSGARYGLGKNIFNSSYQIEPELMLCSLMLCVVLTLLLYWIIDKLGTRLMPWLTKESKGA